MNGIALALLAMSQAYNLPDGLLSAVCYVESRHVAKALLVDDGGSPSVGICQIKLATARLLGFKGNSATLQKVDVNARLAARYLSYQLRRYRGNVVSAIAAYNSGSLRVDSKGRPRNGRYVKAVIRAWRQGK